MGNGTITVFGGTGFLGRRIVERLIAEAAEIRIAVRHPHRARLPPSSDSRAKVAAVRADVRDEGSVAAAVAGANAVVNSVSAYVEASGVTYAAIHERGAAAVARAAAGAGADRMVHISGIGADPRSTSKYIRSRAQGEALVRETFPPATILRPSVMFGPEDAFLNSLAAVARLSPAFPLIGGKTRLQPVYVGDVAEAVARALDHPAARGEIYELGGPRVYTMRELVRLLLAHMRRTRFLLPIPFPLAAAVAALSELLPSPPLTVGQAELLKLDNVVRETARSLGDLGIAPTSIEEILPTYIRPGGA